MFSLILLQQQPSILIRRNQEPLLISKLLFSRLYLYQLLKVPLIYFYILLNLMECLSSVASAIVPLVSNTIVKHVAYPFTSTTNITHLIRTVTIELADKKQDTATKISNAERENGVPTAQAMRWLQEAEAIEQKAKEIQQNYQQLQRCLCNISPNVCTIYEISRRAAKTQVEVRSLCKRIQTIEVIVRMPPPLPPEMSSTACYDSQSSHKKDRAMWRSWRGSQKYEYTWHLSHSCNYSSP